MQFEIDLSVLNQRGIFPWPGESRDRFFIRANSYQSILKSPAFNLTQELFDAVPDWIELRLESKGLLPWEGAATWIEEECGERAAMIQVKPSLPASLYSQEEVLAHELVHAMRLGFKENRFEEILAYRSSKKAFRRYLGPLFSNPTEVKGFLFLILLTWLIYWAEWIFDIELGGPFLLWTPLFALGLGCLRLMRAQNIFSSALKNLEKALKHPEKSLAVALRLRDQEIVRFSRCSPQEIVAFAKKATDLRWEQISISYF